MTLEDKIYQTLVNNPNTYPVQQCEQIADNFAVNFANWSWDKTLITINDIDLFEYRFNVYSGKELLKMYKTEKGL